MRALVAGVVMAGLLCGCAISSKPQSFNDDAEAPTAQVLLHGTQEPGTVPVMFKRDIPGNSMSIEAAVAPLAKIIVDGHEAVRLAPGQKATIFLAPGTHALGPYQTQFEITAAGPNMFRLSFGAGFVGWGSRWRFTRNTD